MKRRPFVSSLNKFTSEFGLGFSNKWTLEQYLEWFRVESRRPRVRPAFFWKTGAGVYLDACFALH